MHHPVELPANRNAMSNQSVDRKDVRQVGDLQADVISPAKFLTHCGQAVVVKID
jgi:hypothetical protein